MAPGTLLKHLLLISLFLNWYFFISKLVLLYFEIGISLFLNLYFFTSKLVFLYFEIGISLFRNWYFSVSKLVFLDIVNLTNAKDTVHKNLLTFNIQIQLVKNILLFQMNFAVFVREKKFLAFLLVLKVKTL